MKKAKHNCEIYPEMIPQGEKACCKQEFEYSNLNSVHSNCQTCFRNRSPCFGVIVAQACYLGSNRAAFMSAGVNNVLHLVRTSKLERPWTEAWDLFSANRLQGECRQVLFLETQRILGAVQSAECGHWMNIS